MIRRYARTAAGHVLLDDEGGATVLDGPPWAGGQPTDQSSGPGAELLCPVAPSKIVGIGRNYAEHARELGNAVPDEPLLFLKPPSALIGPGGTVRLPPQSSRVEHEAELGVVMGRGGVPFGYTIVCDVTARDLQRADKTWARGKGFDTFCPVGPVLVSGLDTADLGVRLWVGDVLRQDGTTRDMLVGVEALVRHISAVMTLEPGDLIATGTPAGVGPLVHGDAVRIEIDGLGALTFDVREATR